MIDKKIYSIPNILSLLRLALVPVLAVSACLNEDKLFLLLLGISLLSDMLDGYFARKLGQTTAFGAFLDPVADKLIVAAALLLICHQYHEPLITVPAVILLLREIFISSLREWLGGLGLADKVKVSTIGKFKTAAQMIGLIGICLLYTSPSPRDKRQSRMPSSA